MRRRGLQLGALALAIGLPVLALSLGKKVGELEPAGCADCVPLTLYVSNQSLAERSVGLEVLAGRTGGSERRLVAGDFEVGDQHRWERFGFRAQKTTLTLSVKAEGKLPATCTLDLEPERQPWVVVSYWGRDGLQCEASAAAPGFL